MQKERNKQTKKKCMEPVYTLYFTHLNIVAVILSVYFQRTWSGFLFFLNNIYIKIEGKIQEFPPYATVPPED